MELPPCPICGLVNTWNSCYHVTNNCPPQDHEDRTCFRCSDFLPTRPLPPEENYAIERIPDKLWTEKLEQIIEDNSELLKRLAKPSYEAGIAAIKLLLDNIKEEILEQEVRCNTYHAIVKVDDIIDIFDKYQKDL